MAQSQEEAQQSQVHLRVLAGPDRGKGWDLDPRQVYTLGRSRRCNLRLEGPTVSGVHARLACEDGVWTVGDQGSRHGTRVNQQRLLARKPLFDRDRLQLGKTLLEFRNYVQLDPEDLAEIDRGLTLLDD